MLETVKEEIMRPNFDLMEIFLLLDKRYDINFSNMINRQLIKIYLAYRKRQYYALYICAIFSNPFYKRSSELSVKTQ